MTKLKERERNVNQEVDEELGKPGKPTKLTYTERERVSHWNGRDSSQGRQTPKRPEGDQRKKELQKGDRKA